MPSVPPRVPKYCFHKPRGLAYVRIRGTCRYLGKYNSDESLEAYRRLLAELAAAPAAAEVCARTGAYTAAPACNAGQELTVLELGAAYLDFAEGYYVKDGRPTDQMGNVRRALRLTKELYGHTRAVDVGPLALRAIQEHMVNSGVHPQTGKPVHYSRTTINSTCDCIRRMFKWAAAQELIPVTVYQALATVPGLKRGRTTAREPAPIRPVPNEVVDPTLPHLPPVVADMVRFQRLTGARPGEVCQLRPMDLDRTAKVWQYRPASHKTEHHGRARIIFVGPQAQGILLPYLYMPADVRPFPLRPADACCFSPAESEDKRRGELRARRKTRLQPSQRNRRKAKPARAPSTAYNKSSYHRAILRGVGKANRTIEEEAKKQGTEPRLIPQWHPNQLRHSAATEIRRKFGLEAAQTVLGHAKADVTQVYAERDYALAADVMEKIG
jgi:integrase